MISKIFARNFKGLDFDQELGPLTLFVGANGVGKSARAHALTLAVLGYLPQDQAKQPGAIYATHGSGQEMIVAFEAKGARFARKYKRGEDGAVSHTCSLDGKAIPQKNIERVLFDLGSPVIFDLRAWMELSEQKKIEFLLELSPPSADLRKINQELLDLDEKEKKLRAELRAKKMVVEQLTGERAAIKLPAGTLAEIQAEIKAKEEDLAQAQEELKRLEIEQREARAKEEAERKAVAEAEAVKVREAKAAEASRAREAMAAEKVKQAEATVKVLKETIGRNEAELKNLMAKAAAEFKPSLRPEYPPDCLESLRAVKAVLQDSGCEACAAIIVLNLEIQKFQGEGV